MLFFSPNSTPQETAMRVGVYAFDFGPAENLAALAKTSGGQIVIAPPQKPGAALAMLSEFNTCKAVIVGLSSFQTGQELGFVERLNPEIPVFVYEDMPGTDSRPMVRERNMFDRFDSVLLAMPDAYWKTETLKLGYRHAVHLGPPVHWGAIYRAMVSPHVETVRAVLHGGNNAPVFFFAGIKNWDVVNDILTMVKDAARGSSGRLAFRPHPGESPKEPDGPVSDTLQARENYAKNFLEYKKQKPLYDAAMVRRREILQGVALVDVDGMINRGEATFPEVVAASDIPIFTGGATDSLIAAYARVSAIYYAYPEAVENLRRQCLIGDGQWFVAELGGAYKATNPEEFRQAVGMIFSRPDTLRKAQEEFFPLPPTWDTAPAVLDFVAARVKQLAA